MVSAQPTNPGPSCCDTTKWSDPRHTIGPVDSGEVVLLVTVALLVVYVIGIGGATATAIRVSEAWRRRPAQVAGFGPRADGEAVLQTPALPAAFRRVPAVGCG